VDAENELAILGFGTDEKLGRVGQGSHGHDWHGAMLGHTRPGTQATRCFVRELAAGACSFLEGRGRRLAWRNVPKLQTTIQGKALAMSCPVGI
jgi:hypothetical protein